MNTRIVPLLASLLLLLGLACQQSDSDVGQLVDEQIAAALAAVPTITPQPTATPQAVSVEDFEATIDSLMKRLATAESELKAQGDEFINFVNSGVDEPTPDVILTGPLAGSIVTIAVESTTSEGRCWQYRVASDGTGNTFLVEWELEGISDALCHNPSSLCVREVEIGGPLPRSCFG